MYKKVFLVEDEFRIREGIRECIEKESGFHFAGEAADGEMALAMINEIKPDIIITDIKMPFMDGLTLSKIVKRTMPFVHIIIISGHDEFEYAQNAILTGVDAYLLKPIRSAELLRVLSGVADQIELNRHEKLNQEKMMEQLNLASQMSKDRLMEDIICANADTPQLLEQCEKIGLDLMAKCFIVLYAEVETDAFKNNCFIYLRSILDSILDESAVYYYRTYDRFFILLKGDNEEQLREFAYSIAQSIRHEFERESTCTVKIGIGSLVRRIAEIPTSYHCAKKAKNYLDQVTGGRIIGIDDINNNSFICDLDIKCEPIDERLNYAESEDIDKILTEYFGQGESDGLNSILFAYYKLTDILVACARLIHSLGKKPEAILHMIGDPNAILQYAKSKDQLCKVAEEALRITFEERDNAEGLKYGGIIRQAKKYINKNFDNPGLSLNSVAKVVSLSPNHFSTIFSQKTGQTVIEYLTAARIDRAKNLLKETNLKLYEIAQQVGYNEPHYFSFIFKKHTGLSPSEYRVQ